MQNDYWMAWQEGLTLEKQQNYFLIGMHVAVRGQHREVSSLPIWALGIELRPSDLVGRG